MTEHDFQFALDRLGFAGWMPADEEPEKALRRANAISHAPWRCRALLALLPRLAVEQQTKALGAALAATEEIPQPAVCGKLLVAIGLYLLATERDWLIALAWNAASRIEASDQRWRELVAVAERLPDEQALQAAEQALHAAAAVEDPGNRGEALAAVAEILPAERALPIVRGIEHQGWRIKAMVALVGRLPVEQALPITSSIENRYSRSEALAAVASQLATEQALQVAARIEDDYFRSAAVAAVAAKLPVDHALQLVGTIEDDEVRDQALAAVAARLPPEQALRVANRIAKPECRWAALAAVAERLPTEDALRVAGSIEDNGVRDQALVAVAERLPAEQALQVADGIQDVFQRCLALAAVTGRLPAEQALRVAREALHAAINPEDEPQYCGWALRMVAEELPAEVALQVVGSLEDRYVQCTVLAAVAARLPAERAHQIAERALQIANSIEDETLRGAALAMVENQLPAEQVRAIVSTIGHHHWRIESLALLAERVPAEQALLVAEQVLRAANGIETDYLRCQVLLSLADRLPQIKAVALFRLALEAFASIPEHWDRATALADAIEQFPAELALEAVRRLSVPAERARALLLLADRLEAEQAEAVVEEALAIDAGPEESPGDNRPVVAVTLERSVEHVVVNWEPESRRLLLNTDGKEAGVVWVGVFDRSGSPSLKERFHGATPAPFTRVLFSVLGEEDVSQRQGHLRGLMGQLSESPVRRCLGVRLRWDEQATSPEVTTATSKVPAVPADGVRWERFVLVLPGQPVEITLPEDVASLLAAEPVPEVWAKWVAEQQQQAEIEVARDVMLASLREVTDDAQRLAWRKWLTGHLPDGDYLNAMLAELGDASGG